MKTLLTAIIGLGLILNINAQSFERTSFKINTKEPTKSFRLDQKIRINKELFMDVSPQFGNQFISRAEAKKARINLKDFYDEFDFGFNMGFKYSFKKQLHLKAFYNIGLLRFDESKTVKAKGFVIQLSLQYII